MAGNKFIIPLSAVFLTAGLVTWTESAFALKCTRAERQRLPSCLEVWELDKYDWPIGRRDGGTGFSKGALRYNIYNQCGREIKIHEDVRNGEDDGYKIGAGQREYRRTGGWGRSFRKIDCCDVRTGDYHYTCGEREWY